MKIEIELDDPERCDGCLALVFIKYPGRVKSNPACKIGFTGEQYVGFYNEKRYIGRPKECIGKLG